MCVDVLINSLITFSRVFRVEDAGHRRRERAGGLARAGERVFVDDSQEMARSSRSLQAAAAGERTWDRWEVRRNVQVRRGGDDRRGNVAGE